MADLERILRANVRNKVPYQWYMNIDAALVIRLEASAEKAVLAADRSETAATRSEVAANRAENATATVSAQVTAAQEAAAAAATSEANAAATLAGAAKKADLLADNGGTNIRMRLTDADAVSADFQVLIAQRPSINNFGAPLDGVASASDAIQKMADSCDARRARYIYIPNWNTNYQLTSTVTVVNPGVRIFGDQGGTYNRGTTKLGWLEGAAGLTRMFDLGGSRTTGNPADQWQIDGLSLRQAVGVPARSIDGVAFTSRTNGPDRGVVVRDMSFIGLRDAITSENPDLETMLANLSVEGCVFQGCRSALNLRGNTLGVRFVGNQCEQNSPEAGQGVIRGFLNGGITITDNMLEGQSNVVSLEIPPVTGNFPQVLFARNYLEANTGDYVIRFRSQNSSSHLTIGPNMAITMNAKDYALIEGGAGCYVENNDNFPVVFKNTDATIRYGSRILNKQVRSYGVRQLTGSSSPEIVMADFQGFADDQAQWVHALAPSGTTAMTPYGSRNVITDNTYISAPMVVAAGDLVCVNILMRANVATAGSLILGIANDGGVLLRGGGGQTFLPTDLKGRWALVSVPFISNAAATNVRVRLLQGSGSYPRAIAGFTVRNFGAFVNDASARQLIEPVVPNIP